MSRPYNPYAAPQAELDQHLHDEEDVWREKKLVVMRLQGHFPKRCVKCNAPVTKPAKMRTVYWHSPWYYLTLLIYFIVYLIVALIVRKKAKIDPGLCVHHTRQRILVQITACGSLVVALLLLRYINTTAPTEHRIWLQILIFVMIFGSIGMALWVSRTLAPVRIDDQVVKLRGAGKAFLDSLSDRRC